MVSVAVAPAAPAAPAASAPAAVAARVFRARSILHPEFFVLAALSAVAHWWRLFVPRAVLFDEAHYKRFASHYFDGTFYYDVHPPLANLLYAGVAKAFGLSIDTLRGADPAVQLRVLPAMLGTLIVPLAYILLRQLNGTRRIAAIGAFALLCENALLVDTRLALIEPLLIGFGLIAIVSFLAADSRAGGSRWAFLATSALFAGLAVSSKWTGASALGLILARWAIRTWRARKISVHTVGEAAVLTLIPTAIYLGTFAVHFALLPRAGPDLTILRVRFQETLIGARQYNPAARLSFADKFAEVHDAMRRGNRSLEAATHPASSPWYTWPIMKHPIGLWQQIDPANASQRTIVLLGNPVLWWGSLAVVGLCLLVAARRRDLFRPHAAALAFLGGGVFINFAPFIAIRRIMYIYHYLFALALVVLLAAYCGGILAGWQDEPDDRLFAFSSRRSALLFWATAALIAAGFVYFLPFVYGWPLSTAAYDQRFWILHPF